MHQNRILAVTLFAATAYGLVSAAIAAPTPRQVDKCVDETLAANHLKLETPIKVGTELNVCGQTMVMTAGTSLWRLAEVKLTFDEQDRTREANAAGSHTTHQARAGFSPH